MKGYLCAAVKVSYVEQEIIDDDGSTTKTEFPFDCQATNIVDGLYQIQFKISINTAGDVEETDGDTGLSLYTGTTRNIQLKRTANFKQGVTVNHGDDLDGVFCNFALFYSESDIKPSSEFTDFLNDPLTIPLAYTQSY